MITTDELFFKIINGCAISFDDHLISNDALIQEYISFLKISLTSDKKQNSIILHTDSIIFDALLILFSGLTNILKYQSDTDDELRGLDTGDKVLYKNKRWRFDGFSIGKSKIVNDIDKATHIKLHSDGLGNCYVPKCLWKNIRRYYGSAVSHDGRGIAKAVFDKRQKFFRNILCFTESELNNKCSASLIIVMPRATADQIIKSLKIVYDKDIYCLSDILTISYCTKEKDYPYPGNISKAEPIIKIVPDISCARVHVFNSSSHTVGLVISGHDQVNRGRTELPRLLSETFWGDIVLSFPISSFCSGPIVQQMDDALLFACTKELLNYVYRKVDNQASNSILYEQALNILEENVEIHELKSGIDIEEYYQLLEMIRKTISDNAVHILDKETFIKYSYSLVNLFTSSAFLLCNLEKAITAGSIKHVISIKEKLDFVKGWSDSKNTVYELLNKMYCHINNNAPKHDKLIDVLKQHTKQSIAVIVPKKYHISLLKDDFQIKYGCAKKIEFFTPKTFLTSKTFDILVIVSGIAEEGYNFMQYNNARNKVVLLYDIEKLKFEKNAKCSESNAKHFNERNYVLPDLHKDQENNPSSPKEVQEDLYGKDIVDIEDAILKHIEEQNSKVIISAAANSLKGNDRRNMVPTIAYASFTTGEYAFFTENYKAYVIDQEKKAAKELSVKELAEGDTIVFTRANEKTRDIVDTILNEMITQKQLSDDLIAQYRLSKRWKEVLRDHMFSSGKTARQIAEEMKKNGVSVQENTVLKWFDEDAHIIRPKKLDSIQQIAYQADDNELLDNAEKCFEAGRLVYGIRSEILNLIGRVQLGAKMQSANEQIVDRIKRSTEKKEIQFIKFIRTDVPVGIINRTIEGDKE